MKKISFVIIVVIVISCLIYSSGISRAKFKIVFNFDDGYQGIYNNAFPVMKKHNFPGVIFMPTNYVGRKNHLTMEQLKTIREAGWEIGSHTIHHPDLSQLTKEGIYNEIIGSRHFLKENELLMSNYASFCSPMTVWNQHISSVVSRGYQIARGKKLYNFAEKNKEIPADIRVIVNDTNLKTIKTWISKSYKSDRLLILVFHGIGKEVNEYYYSTAKFNKILLYINDKYQNDVKTYYELFFAGNS